MKSSGTGYNKDFPGSGDSKVDCTLRGTGGHTYLTWCLECRAAVEKQNEMRKLKEAQKLEESEGTGEKVDDAGRSALLTAKLCAGRTALCII